MILLVDADILVYQIACRNEENYSWDDETISQYTDLPGALQEIDEKLGEMMQKTNCDDLLLCYTSSPNFRHQVLPTYKANRRGKPLPVLYRDIQKYCLDTFPWKRKANLEADDVLGILGTQYPTKYIIASCDKDLKQIPGEHYNWQKDERFTMSNAEADFQFYMQCLTGDPTDNYKGCPGIGKIKAEKILLDAVDCPWVAIKETYVRKNLTEADALQQARVARILRCTDYDFKKRQPILWCPN